MGSSNRFLAANLIRPVETIIFRLGVIMDEKVYQ